MTDEIILTLDSLSVGYDGAPLIRGITLPLKRGQILTLIGPNGAGKSTILKTIARQLRPVCGTVFLSGKALSRYSPAELARRMAVLLTEKLDPDMMTCFDVAAMGRYPYTGRFGLLTAEDRAVVADKLRLVRAEDIADRPFSRVSDGQRQRVLLARALCQQPEVMILDEPTSYLDIRHKIDLLAILLAEARERGLTVVMSLHEIDLAEKISDIVLCVKGETIAAVGAPEEIFTPGRIAGLYDLSGGSYLVGSGSVEMPAPDGEPRVFVLCGAGRGLPRFRALQRRRIPFSCGILFENDSDFEAASVLAVRVIASPPFMPIAPETVERAKREILACGALLDAGTPIGEFNRAHEELLRFARKNGLPIVKEASALPSDGPL